MVPLGNPRAHFWLTLGMAKAVGADLSAALHEERITHTDYSDIINRCRACDHAVACAAKLSRCRGQLDQIPDYCLNRDLLETLAA